VAIGIVVGIVNCGGPPGGSITAPYVLSGFNRGGSSPYERPLRPNSWLSRDAASQDLLYITDLQEVRVFSYPKGRYQGTLLGFEEALGACVDQGGNVYIADGGYNGLFEYAHGGKKRLRAIYTGNPQDCSVDRSSGNLAVTNGVRSGRGGPGSVAVLTNAHGKPKYYRDPDFLYYDFCSYDDQGNLFVDGLAQPSGINFVFAELPKGGAKLMTITLNQAIGFPGGVQWDGQHVVVGDQDNATVYAFAINGSQGTLTGDTHFNGAEYVKQTWIEGQRIIAPNSESGSDPDPSVLIYRYPAGGSAVKTISKHVLEPQGAAVSKAPTN
jgi:hypothetical protein